jgi:tRNA (cytosine38-C5)-methyltransferase
MQGLQLGQLDKRASALLHLIEVLQSCGPDVLPTYLLLENVVGFESSGTRCQLHAALRSRGFAICELWASPAQFRVPNQRTRYFLLARRGQDFPPPPPAIAPLLLCPADLEATRDLQEPIPPPRGEVPVEIQQACEALTSYLLPVDAPQLAGLRVADHILERYGAAMDVVGRSAHRSICFTKNYSRYVKGVG